LTEYPCTACKAGYSCKSPQSCEPVTFRRFDEAALIMGTLPFALTGGIWFLYVKGYNLSVATGVGFIALAGVAAEFGVVMLLYLKQAIAARLNDGLALTSDMLVEGILMRRLR
jgi:Cu(I)/Ag(I) efflux system membrane protein CusA/SilA